MRGFNKGRRPNAKHFHISGAAASEPELPEFDGTVAIASTEIGGLTGLWNLDLTLQDSLGSPLSSSALVTITMVDTTNGSTVAWATYQYGDVIGTDSPQSESNWTSLVVPFLTGATIEDGTTIGFTLFDYLIDEDDLENNNERTFTFELYASDSSQPSSTDSDTVVYDFEMIEYTTTRTGTHSATWRITSNDYGLIDWGDGTIDPKYFTNGGITPTHTYADSTEKTVRVYIPNDRNVTYILMTSQALTSFSDFDTSALGSLLLRFNPALTSLPDFTFTVLTSLNLEYCGFTTINSAWDLSSVTSLIQLNNNSLTSVPAAWDVSNCQNIRLQGNNLSSLPAWDVSSCQDLRLADNNLTSLPSTWNVANVTNLLLGNNNLTSLPSTWNVASVVTLDLDGNASLSALPASWESALAPVNFYIENCAFTAIPAVDFSNCVNFRSQNNSIASVPLSLALTSIVSFQILNEAVAAWDQTAISNTLTNLNLQDNSLTQAEVDDVLAQLRTSYDALNRVIVAILDNNTAPSATGLADKAYLIGNGCTITTD